MNHSAAAPRWTAALPRTVEHRLEKRHLVAQRNTSVREGARLRLSCYSPSAHRIDIASIAGSCVWASTLAGTTTKMPSMIAVMATANRPKAKRGVEGGWYVCFIIFISLKVADLVAKQRVQEARGSGQRRSNKTAAALRLAGHFGRNRSDFVADEAEVAQRPVVELAQRLIGISRPTAFLVARVRPNHDGTDHSDRGGDQIAEESHTMPLSFFIQPVAERPGGSVDIAHLMLEAARLDCAALPWPGIVSWCRPTHARYVVDRRFGA